MLVKAKCCVIWSAKTGAYLKTHYQSQQLHTTYQSVTGFSLLQCEHGLHVLWPSGPPSMKYKVAQWLQIIFEPAIYFKICDLRWVEADWQHRREVHYPACCFCRRATLAAQITHLFSTQTIHASQSFQALSSVYFLYKAGRELVTSTILQPRSNEHRHWNRSKSTQCVCLSLFHMTSW